MVEMKIDYHQRPALIQLEWVSLLVYKIMPCFTIYSIWKFMKVNSTYQVQGIVKQCADITYRFFSFYYIYFISTWMTVCLCVRIGASARECLSAQAHKPMCVDERTGNQQDLVLFFYHLSLGIKFSHWTWQQAFLLSYLSVPPTHTHIATLSRLSIGQEIRLTLGTI